jgi:pimeloyl-ACP methyl ester carboxylesterase
MAALTPIRTADGAGAAIVFVHGFTGRGLGTWCDLAPRIADVPRLASWDCWAVTYSTNWLPDISGIWSADADLPTLAARLATDLSMGTLARYKALVLVAHSMGGLVVQKALVDTPAVALKTSAVVLFGTPSNGLIKALPLWCWKRQLDGMTRDGPFIRQLRADWTDRFAANAPFSFLSVAGERDQFVPPASSLAPFPAEQRAVVRGNHVSMIHPKPGDPNVVDLVARRIVERGAIDRGDPAMRAIESAEFQQIIPADLADADKLDRQALIRLAIALDAVGRRDDAHRVLAARDELCSDVLGAMARLIKRKWLLDRHEADAQAALAYYTEGFELAAGNLRQEYYHGVNLAFLALVFANDRERAKEWAEKVLAICRKCAALGVGDEWLDATFGQAYLIAGDNDAALESYRRFLAADNAEWKLCATYLTAREIAVTLANRELARNLGKVFGDPDP